MAEHYILDIEWDRESPTAARLPPLVGPFDSADEAREWGRLNIPNGVWECRPLGRPYMRASGERLAAPASADDAGRAS